MKPSPEGPWSVQPDRRVERRPSISQTKPPGWKPTRRRAREPFINRWRPLLLVAFLLFVAPVLASWAARWIMSAINGG